MNSYGNTTSERPKIRESVHKLAQALGLASIDKATAVAAENNDLVRLHGSDVNLFRTSWHEETELIIDWNPADIELYKKTRYKPSNRIKSAFVTGSIATYIEGLHIIMTDQMENADALALFLSESVAAGALLVNEAKERSHKARERHKMRLSERDRSYNNTLMTDAAVAERASNASKALKIINRNYVLSTDASAAALQAEVVAGFDIVTPTNRILLTLSDADNRQYGVTGKGLLQLHDEGETNHPNIVFNPAHAVGNLILAAGDDADSVIAESIDAIADIHFRQNQAESSDGLRQLETVQSYFSTGDLPDAISEHEFNTVEIWKDVLTIGANLIQRRESGLAEYIPRG